MRLGIDACCWSNRRGFGRFTRELVSHMVRDCPQHEYTLVVDAATAADGSFPPGARLEVVRTRAQPTQAASAEGARSPLDLLRLSRAASRLPLDAFFFPAVYSYYPLLRRMPTVVTFHDAIAEAHPELIFPSRRARLFWKAKTWLARRQADRLLSVSESAKAQIVEAFGHDPRNISVVTEGPGDGFRVVQDPAALAAVRERYRLPAAEPLLLYVGGISPHKNLQGLLQAFAVVAAARACHLTIVGDYSNDSFYGCYQELLELRERLALEPRVTFTGFVPNDDLVLLYNAATLLVLPSFAEGFGLPVVEAMACGLPVAASACGSLPEIVGSAGVLFDPRDGEAMPAALLRVLDDEALRARLRNDGLARSERFSWSAAARDTVRLFEELSVAR